jgi:two-component sensor histidine kinase
VRYGLAAAVVCCLFACSDPATFESYPLKGGDTLSWYEDVLQEAGRGNNTGLQAEVYEKFGDYYYTHSDLDSALRYYKLQEELAAEHLFLHHQVSALINQSRCYTDLGSYDQTLFCVDSALKVSRAQGDSKDIAWALQEMAIYHYAENNYDTAIRYFSEELKYDIAIEDSVAASACMNNLATVYTKKGDYKSSIGYYEEAIRIGTALQADTAVAEYRANLGIAYKEVGSYEPALEHLFAAARFLDEIKAVKDQTSCYSAIGNIYMELGNLDKALEYHMLTLELREKIGYTRGVAMSYTNVGQALMKRGKYDSALVYLEHSLELKEQLKDTALISSSLDLIGETHYFKNDFPVANAYYRKALMMKERVGDRKGKAGVLNKLGQLYYAWNKPDSALVKLEEGRRVLEPVGAKKTLLENYKITMDVLRQQNRMEEAWDFNTKYIQLKDSVLNEQMSDDVAEKQVKYETDKLGKEVVELTEKDKTQTNVVARQTKLIYAFIGSLFLVVAVLVLTVIAYRSRKRALRQSEVIISQKQIIIEQKQTMMKELHHRVKNNLQVLSNILQLQQEKIGDGEVQKMMKAVELRVDAMLLVHRELYAEREDALIDMRRYLDNLIGNVISSFEIDRRQIDLDVRVDEFYLKSDTALNIGFICNEALTNSLKHGRKSGQLLRLSVALHENEQGLEVLLSDNGPGFAENTAGVQSNSFGLRLMKLFATTLGAQLHIQSGSAGTSVHFIVPKNNLLYETS